MRHVSLITLGVSEVEASARFYEALGWQRSSASVDGVVAFMTGDGPMVLSLFGRDDLSAEAAVPAASGIAAKVALATNLPTEADVDRALAAARNAGGTVTSPARRAEWGGYSGYFSDPDGHLWEVAYNPGFGLTPEGTVSLP